MTNDLRERVRQVRTSAGPIEILSPSSDQVPLGQFVEIQIAKAAPVETRLFLKHSGVFYLEPLRDWSAEGELTIFPEAPGSYVLVVHWRAPDGATGWAEAGFEVVTRHTYSPGPFLLKLDDRIRLWVPSEWEAKVLEDSERATLGFIKTLIEPGQVVYDLGANLGLYSVLMSRWVGAEGHVYALEANPVCLQFLRTNVAFNRSANVEILPAAVLDRPGDIGFSINYGNSNLGLTEETQFYAAKAGHQIRVTCHELDRLLGELPLLTPQMIKLDVEGAEIAAVRGMRETLERHRPVLVMELHGYANAARTLEILDGLRYTYTDPATREDFGSAGEVCAKLGAAVFQLVAFP